MNTRDKHMPFHIKNNRAMISLGPLNEKKYCPYSCAFCYVQNGFLKYNNLHIDDICDYLEKNKDQFNIIYISGDTDSFAPPRTKQGLSLLMRISEQFDKDILFTTRMVFSDDEMKTFKKVSQILKDKGKTLFACVSITSPITDNYIEPKPIKTIDDRIRQLEMFNFNGICSILAMRPFLPIYTAQQYKELILNVKGKVDCILGERWYFRENDVIYNRVMQGKAINKGNIVSTEMDFDDNYHIWNVWYEEKLEKDIEGLCRQMNIPFYMRSAPAIECLKNLRRNI